jgi:hypothetical protein
MKAATRVLAKACYGLFGAGMLVAGASVLLVGAGLLANAHRDAIVAESRGDLDALHVGQEFGSLLVFAGLMSFWFIRHYDRSRFFHWALTAFWGLLALVHWFDVRGPSPSVVGPLVNTIPFALFVAVGLLRAVTEGEPDRGETRSAVSREQPPRPESSPHDGVLSQV